MRLTICRISHTRDQPGIGTELLRTTEALEVPQLGIQGQRRLCADIR